MWQALCIVNNLQMKDFYHIKNRIDVNFYLFQLQYTSAPSNELKGLFEPADTVAGEIFRSIHTE